MNPVVYALTWCTFIVTVFCFETQSLNDKKKNDHASISPAPEEYDRQEHLGVLYYESQKKEDRHSDYGHVMPHLNPNFPCVRGVVPVGFDTNESIDDGHKFACGVSFISSAPIVYSFGSNLQTDFERAFYDLRKDSKIYVFEIDKTKIPTISSPYNESIFIFNHVLKMDIESMEWQFIEHEAKVLRNVGQLLVELHDPDTKHRAIYFLEKIEAQGLNLFFKELNHYYKVQCTELSFIQKRWGVWDSEKKDLQL
eukprot:gene28388-37322_t